MPATRSTQIRKRIRGPPWAGATIVPRARLIEHWSPAATAPVVLIDAPAGFGKSTLLRRVGRSRPATIRAADARPPTR